MFVTVDKRTGELEFRLPVSLEQYRNAVKRDIMEEFAFEAMNKATLERMNLFVLNWFEERNIELPRTEQNGETE
ncbi:MAG: hypothetical protein JW881_16785 [Spirochaetales bacterium]|nr:hypothetical protein [Spirochaetales bacterium]